MENRNNVLISLIILVLTPLVAGDDEASLSQSSSLVIASHCSSKCGNVTIPYPFGIEEGCYYAVDDNPIFRHPKKINCNHTFSPPKPIFGKNVHVTNISMEESEIWINGGVAVRCYGKDEYFIGGKNRSLEMVNYTISSAKNMFVATGCDTYAWFTGKRYGKPYKTGCMTTCNELDDVVDNQCNGVGCCQVSIPDGVTNLKINAYSVDNHTNVDFNPCSTAYTVAKDWFKFKKDELMETLDFYVDKDEIPIIFNWGIGSKKCSAAIKDGDCLCKNNTDCINLKDQDGYRCKCKDGYNGNPYLPQGCTEINECMGANDCEKPEYCHNTIGNYTCSCPSWYRGSGTKTNGCHSIIKIFIPVIVTAGTGFAIIIFLVIGFLFYRRHQVEELEQLRRRLFRRNGGTFLNQKLPGMDILKIFTAKELEDATDKYKETTIIGRGGYGVVYRGVLSNNQQVAIKRSLKIDPEQVEQFINEILVLSQINNRNVVKLLGCCLETDVPLLVYEYISNGTLHDHLHRDGESLIFPWNVRLRVATEIAEVLSYLHTTISTPIIHRDIKSMNILLDGTFTAKVADFGASKLVPSGKGEKEISVPGTMGYIDPEYMQTYKLTDKSDVYSFGVVLVELLTTKQVLPPQRGDAEESLAIYFLIKMKDDHLFDIVDKQILSDEGQFAQIKEVANLAKWCLTLKGEERPTMKEVAMELERIKRISVPLDRTQYADGKPSDQLEDHGGHLVGIPTNDDEDSIIVGQDSDLYSDPTYVSHLGSGR